MSTTYENLFSLQSNTDLNVSELTKYAILSHTWLRSTSAEVTYSDWYSKTFDMSHIGYRKLVNFCKVASADFGLTLGWIDTVCIDKSSSSELDESIRSMYKWYQKSAVCITYLSETITLDDMASDPWFTRGWTLQELIAPMNLKFYTQNWVQLVGSVSNDKAVDDIQNQIEIAANITGIELSSPSSVPVSRKMEWAARRQVTRGEDTAYSLMGLFGINMSIAYGEGPKTAFIRLIKKILATSKSEILDIFNW
ncbi:hypothetical protein BDN70DRAFT_810788, partial [Pholiota conissans]